MVDLINNSLSLYGLPVPTVLSASISSVVQTDTCGSGTIYFNKTVPGSITKVNVYNLFDTTCSFTMSCPTPAQPVIPTLPCGGDISHYGTKVSYPYYKDYPVQIGSGTGTVVLTYDAITVPDRFQVIYEGGVVIETYWRGSQNYRNALNTLGFTEPIYTNSGAGNPGAGSASFPKTTNTPYAVLRVYSPLTGTAWKATLACPV
jgi:hypothetical protein